MANGTECLLAIFFTMSLSRRGDQSEPRGEYDVTTIPFSAQNSLISGWLQELLGGGERQLVREYHKLVRVKFNLIDSGYHSGFFEESLKIWHREVADAFEV